MDDELAAALKRLIVLRSRRYAKDWLGRSAQLSRLNKEIDKIIVLVEGDDRFDQEEIHGTPQ